MYDEAELRQMSREERARLARALAALDAPRPLSDAGNQLRRRLLIAAAIACAAALAAWIGVLAVSLPPRYRAGGWQAAWVGFDIGLLAVFLAMSAGVAEWAAQAGTAGLSAGSRQLIMPDTRGTGASADPADPATFRCDRLARDVEALRAHLGLERMDLLGHSAAGNVALLYAAAHPSRLDRLVLLTPSLSAVGIETTGAQQAAVMERWSAEPWYAGARAALEKAKAGDSSPETRRGYMPFLYGRWDEAVQAHASVGVSERALALQDELWAEGAFDPAATRRALGGLAAPVLIYAGGRDFLPSPEVAAQAAGIFARAEVVVQPGAAHFPWLDDPARFTAAIDSFLG